MLRRSNKRERKEEGEGVREERIRREEEDEKKEKIHSP